MHHQCLPETAKIFVFALPKMVFRDFLMISAAFTQQYQFDSWFDSSYQIGSTGVNFSGIGSSSGALE